MEVRINPKGVAWGTEAVGESEISEGLGPLIYKGGILQLGDREHGKKPLPHAESSEGLHCSSPELREKEASPGSPSGLPSHANNVLVFQALWFQEWLPGKQTGLWQPWKAGTFTINVLRCLSVPCDMGHWLATPQKSIIPDRQEVLDSLRPWPCQAHLEESVLLPRAQWPCLQSYYSAECAGLWGRYEIGPWTS